MKDQNQTEMQLINELVELRKRIAELKTLENERKQIEEALRKSDERYRTLFEESRDAIYTTTQEGEFLDANQSMLNLFGYSREEIIGLKAGETYVHPDDRLKFKQKIGCEGFVRDYEIKLRKKDGTEMECLLTAIVRKTADGNIFGYQGIIRDITERKRAEEEYRTILRTTMDGFWTADMHGRFLDVNDAYCQLIGYSRDELLTMRISDMEAVERPEETAQRIQRIMETGEARFETRHRCKDGRMIDLEVSVNYAKIGDGRLYVFLRDITERKRAEEALKESELKYRTLIESSTDAILLLDVERNIVTCNQGFLNLFGYQKGEIEGRSIRIIHPSDESFHSFGKTAYPVIARSGFFRTEWGFTHKDGIIFPTETVTSAIKLPDGSITGYIAIIRDITERKGAEEEREKLIHELQEALANIKTLRGLLPICSHCKKIRDDKGYWNQIESYIRDHSGAEFTHGMCPECMKKLYPDLVDYVKKH